LNCASLYGLSLLTFGRECDLRIARSDSSADTGFDVIEVPVRVDGRRRDAAVKADRLAHEVFRQLAQLRCLHLEMHSSAGENTNHHVQVVTRPAAGPASLVCPMTTPGELRRKITQR
jgi:hypothetical protein